MGSAVGEYAGVNPLEPAAVTDAAGLVLVVAVWRRGSWFIGPGLAAGPALYARVAFTLGHGRQRLGVGAEFTVIGMSAEWFNDPVE